MRIRVVLPLLAALTSVAARGECDGTSTAHTVGGVAFATGALVTVAALVTPLFVCRSSTTTDSQGRITDHHNPCDDFSDGVKIAWVSTLGGALALTVGGGILYFETSPKPGTIATIAPWVTTTSGGATFVARF